MRDLTAEKIELSQEQRDSKMEFCFAMIKRIQ